MCIRDRDIISQIILDSPALIVVGPAAFCGKFAADLEAVEKELAHIVSDAVKVFD